jgi:hypothetical protein
MARANEPNFAPALVERIKKLVRVDAGNAEDRIDSVLYQGIDKRLRRRYCFFIPPLNREAPGAPAARSRILHRLPLPPV